MEYIRELITLVASSAIGKKLENIGNKTLLAKLYRAIRAQDVVNEQEIVHVLYGGHAGVSWPAYQKLKSRLRNVLRAALLECNLEDKPSYKTREIARQALIRQYASAQLLLSNMAYRNAAVLLEKVHRKAVEYDFIELKYQCAQLLMGIYLGVLMHPEKFMVYAEAADLYRDEYRDFGEATQLFYAFKSRFYQRIGTASQIGIYGVEAADKIMPSLKKHPQTNAFAFIYYEMKAMGHFFQGEFMQAIQIAKEAEAEITQRNDFQKNRLFPFQILQVRALGMLTSGYHDGLLLLEKMYAYTSTYTLNWIKIVEDHILFCIRHEKYEDALLAADKVNPRLVKSKLRGLGIELWELIDAILYILRTYKVDGNQKDYLRQKAFKVQRFLNNVPRFSKEKRGMNVQVLSIHTAILILDNKFYDAITRVEALQSYCSRYLRNDEYLRGNCFIRMLVAVVKGDFHAVAANRHAKPYVKQLHATPVDLIAQTNYAEIIPYEMIWSLIINHLEGGAKVKAM